MGEEVASVQAMVEGDDARFRQLADQAPLMIWRCDAAKHCDFFNRPWLEFTGRRMETELGFRWVELVHPEDAGARVAAFSAAFNRRESFSIEYRLRRHDGAWRWLLDNGQPTIVGGRFTGYIGSCIDITETRQALEARRRAIEERESLLSELQHRVKNNAQATTSFLSLQASRASDASVAAALRGAATRVMLATLVQDRMFHIFGDVAVDLGEELASTARTALEFTGRPGLTLALRLENQLELPVAQATPLALIVNELVVNAARHAFPHGRAGTITLLVRQAGPGIGEVVVADDGIGLPETHTRTSPQGCLGLHLMPRLARQARATIRFDAEAGTTATLRFACGGPR
jgi:PAS domain S-box-containing protein